MQSEIFCQKQVKSTSKNHNFIRDVKVLKICEVKKRRCDEKKLLNWGHKKPNLQQRTCVSNG